ncbi:hypothetical protein [Pseudoxanthomonas wuyuanensis]|uniref:Uncharacterized protein n=1 Tax=Pseudoxanthomonas wuyuanensis TaxID=1073196 RepID=A0A286DEK6_9GAMM|nr:hypothetical protein [Pseudoxanthomonas wuyuanensis]KAF1719866.1 hypothetical protein CSC75_13155 [Pseudoxanthomonas wuyuanensis]SOD57081.1 hypothetical protein SAMN06296416_11211 [Pseudoxanthomonas wuyuanensis]
MSRLTIITERALELASQAGSSLKQAVPSADKLLQTGAALGAVKTGAKVARGFVRRNPVVAIAAAAGVGLLAFAAYHKRRQEAANAPIEGKSKRIEARKVNGSGKTAASKRAAARKPRKSAPSAPANH